ncbi:hypothetical protein pipiens_006968 [Culex pipiens pipiens]|uniref:F-box domain-containing protein n=1 Tax=Culex pipiens pipiens TaxID=38569 RepID=A0ABD1DNL0_CULPP
MPKRKLLTDSGIQPKQPKIEIRLPPEIWQKIFLNLPLKDLIVARLTCHRWRDAVGSSPGLRDKFWLKFPHDRNITMINRNYKPPGTVPASNVMFQLDNYSKIGSIAAWWPQVASTVTCLVMCGCEFPVDVLRHAPNLKSLHLISARFYHINEHYTVSVETLQINISAVCFKIWHAWCRSLTQLERLTVNGLGVSCEATTHLRQYCHKLRYLRLDESWAIPPEDIAYFSKRLDNFYYNRINSSGEDSDLLDILEILKQLSDELSVLLNYC